MPVIDVVDDVGEHVGGQVDRRKNISAFRARWGAGLGGGHALLLAGFEPEVHEHDVAAEVEGSPCSFGRAR